jgi:hypothetical protein
MQSLPAVTRFADAKLPRGDRASHALLHEAERQDRQVFSSLTGIAFNHPDRFRSRSPLPESEHTTTVTPRLSILLPAKLGFDTVLPALEAWDVQTSRAHLEILILCPEHLGPNATQAAQLKPGQIVVRTGSADLHDMRAIGIRQATGEYIVLAEDHCLPDPDYAEAILTRLEEGWDGVGAALRPGIRATNWSEASFLIGYGEWMEPVASGPTDILCGWNGTVRTKLLRDLADELSGLMRVGAFAISYIRRQGGRFYLENRARMRHFDPPGFGRELYLLYVVGLGFGAMRTREWSTLARWLYPLATPAITFLHWNRAFTQFRRAGTAAGLRPTGLAAAAVLAGAWAIGEAIGAVLGIDRVTPLLWVTEVKPVTHRQIAESDALEGRHSASSGRRLRGRASA